jgi:hypothetical protein
VVGGEAAKRGLMWGERWAAAELQRKSGDAMNGARLSCKRRAMLLQIVSVGASKLPTACFKH